MSYMYIYAIRACIYIYVYTCILLASIRTFLHQLCQLEHQTIRTTQEFRIDQNN